MKVAIVTPFNGESRSALQRCVQSVRHQTVETTHIIVGDEKIRNDVDGVSGIRHVVLTDRFNDDGVAERMIGFLLAAGEEYDAIGFLNPDHWLLPNHVEICIATANDNESVDMIVAKRSYIQTNGEPLPLLGREIDTGRIETNCHFVLPGGFHSIATWGANTKPISLDDEGRVFLFDRTTERLNIIWTEEPTVMTRAIPASVYVHLGESPPSDAIQTVDSPVWLIGDGRSGTTWLFNLLNHTQLHRELFEPFNPDVATLGFDTQINRYLSPKETDPDLEKYLSDVFSGRFNDFIHLDTRATSYRRVITKDIYCNLFARWAFERFRRLKIILIIRHPFSVAASKSIVMHWFSRSKVTHILEQPQLVKDHLRGCETLLRRVERENDFIVNQITIWTVINYVPLMQFSPEQIHIVFYEDLIRDPINTLRSVYSFMDAKTGEYTPLPAPSLIQRPSTSTFVPDDDGVNNTPLSKRHERWTDLLTRKQTRQGKRILREFGLDTLYDNGRPDRNVLDRLLESTQ